MSPNFRFTRFSTAIGCRCALRLPLIAADEAAINTAADQFRSLGAEVKSVQVDPSTSAGIDELPTAIQGRPVGALLANAGSGHGHALPDQDFNDVRRTVDTNVSGTIDLIQRVGRKMRVQGDAAPPTGRMSRGCCA